MGTVAVEITAYVDVLAPKLLCSRLLLRAAVVQIARLLIFWLEWNMLLRSCCKRCDRTSSGSLRRRSW